MQVTFSRVRNCFLILVCVWLGGGNVVGQVDTDFVEKIAASLQEDYMQGMDPTTSHVPELEEIQAEGMKVLDRQWLPVDSTQVLESHDSDSEIHFVLPTIHTFCQDCDKVWPFNSVYDGLSCTGYKETTHQWFFLGYQCQSCKGQPIRFLVRRDGSKLRLSGRDPLEVVPVPKFLPKAHGKYYGNALIAHHAGQTLAGIFLLRTFVEQYWRSLPEMQALIQQQPRATGDEQGKIYQATLPDDFKNRFPSLSDIYGKLSAAMHDAQADSTLFEGSCENIVKHFEARRLFEL